VHFKPTLGVRSNVGLKRKENQDSYCHASTRHVDYFIVADGMGGARGGAIASAIAVNVIGREAVDESDCVTAESLSTAIEKTNTIIFEKGCSDENLGGMGTTVVALAISGDEVLVGHVGDSRIYLCRDGNMLQVTRDHTLVQDLIDSGAISEEEAENHPIAHMLTRSLGPSGAVDPDVRILEEKGLSGDRFLLCSDGLYNMVEDKQIEEILAKHEPEKAAELLIEAALEGGGTDNVTVQIVELLEKSDEVESDDVLTEGELKLVASSSIDHIDLENLFAQREERLGDGEAQQPDKSRALTKGGFSESVTLSELSAQEVAASEDQEVIVRPETAPGDPLSAGVERAQKKRPMLQMLGVAVAAVLAGMIAFVLTRNETPETVLTPAQDESPENLEELKDLVSDDMTEQTQERESLTDELAQWEPGEDPGKDAAGAQVEKQWPAQAVVPEKTTQTPSSKQIARLIEESEPEKPKPDKPVKKTPSAEDLSRVIFGLFL